MESPSERIVKEYKGVSACPFGQVRDLRRSCWPHVEDNRAIVDDGFDDEAWHWVIYSRDRLAAAARLTCHSELHKVPDRHLFLHLDQPDELTPFGYISRLVVSPSSRGLGLASTMDKVRIAKAREIGCKSLIAVWNESSGEHRRKQLTDLGFRSPDEGKALSDGAFGLSFVFRMSLSTSLTL